MICLFSFLGLVIYSFLFFFYFFFQHHLVAAESDSLISDVVRVFL